VPFCPESQLSGVAHTDFIDALWYHRSFEVPRDWSGKRVFLHFGGVDYTAEIYIDGTLAGRHYGGSTPFRLDITRVVEAGAEHQLVVHVRDDIRSWRQPSGKQSLALKSHGCLYTRTTGIWQTVWLEAAEPLGLDSAHVVPDLDSSAFLVTPTFHSCRRGTQLRLRLWADDTQVAERTVPAVDGVPVALSLDATDVHPWSPEDPFLYDMSLEVLDESGACFDTVRSYAGLRKVHIEGNRLFLNNEPRYLRLVLDQGFYPGSVWTAPNDDALRRDIEISMAAGFNGARLHQKVFEERFHYWADRLGYLTWGESASWGFDVATAEGAWNFLGEWRDIVTRDRNHPSIITWTPFNESDGRCERTGRERLLLDTYNLTKQLDPTRPVNDSSGWHHQRTDIWSVHAYEQNAAKLAEKLALGSDGSMFRNFPDLEAPYEGQPYVVDEFGGIKWIPAGDQPRAANAWGYGNAPKSPEEFYERLDGLIRAIRSHEHVAGFCYTQLTDVEQEQNGIYDFARNPKLDISRIRRIFVQ